MLVSPDSPPRAVAPTVARRTHAERPIGAIWRRLRSWASPAAIFVVSAFAAAGATGALAVAVLEHAARREADRSARVLTQVTGQGFVESRITPALMAGDPAAVRALDRVVRRRVLHDPIVRVKLWSPKGRIVYSDEPRLIGRWFPLQADDLRTLRTGRPDADVSDLTRAENRYERGRGKLVQVYMRLRATDGRPVLFEAYLRDASITEGGRRLWESFLPALIIGLVLLQLANIPIARSFARRLQRAERQRGDMLKRALEASDQERRAIATNLHDGVVQDLAAAAFTLDAAIATLGPAAEPRALDAIEEARELTRQGMRALRAELVDIYPPDVLRRGLSEALDEVLAMARRRGLDTQLAVPHPLSQPPATQAVLFRIAQEGVRNVVKHADATTVLVTVTAGADRAAIEVRDDGNGLATGIAPSGDHFGLRALRDLVEQAGGRLTLDGLPGLGTTLRAEVPVG
jgi:signal transduction histidine kinase